MQQSINFASVIPIKKRRFPIFESPSPPSEEKPATSEDSKQEPRTFTAATCVSDASKSPALIVTNTSVEIFESKPELEPAISSEPIDDLRKKSDLCSFKESSNQEVLASSMRAPTMIVKQEIGSEQTEGTRELELSTDTQNVELPLEYKEPLLHASELQNSENNFGKSDAVSLSLFLSKEKLDMHDKNNMDTRNVGNRSNWDLNTRMDEWDGSINNVPFSGMSEFSKIGNCDKVNSYLSNHDVKTTAAIMGVCLSRGEHSLREHSSNSRIASLLPGKQSEPDDSLGLSLSVPFGDFDASEKHYFLAKKPDSTDVGPNFNMQSKIVNFAKFRSVKLEPVDEASRSECSVKSSGSDMGLSKSNSVERELIEKYNSGVVSPSSCSSEKLVEHRSIKSETIHERNDEVFKFQDSVRPQHVRRVMQHQASTASSSAMAVPLTPQNSHPSKPSTHTELDIGGDHHQTIDHMNKLNEQITGLAFTTFTQDALCNLGKLTVEDSEKLNATQIDGRSSEVCGKIEMANDEEKINLSTEMLEEDTLGSDSESYENHGVSTLDERQKLCNKEDGEYEEGEVRTPLRHSTGEDPIVDSKKTGNVVLVEHGLRNLQTFVLAGDQSTNTSDDDGKSDVSENHDETHNDHIKECVISGHKPKAEKISSRKLSDNVPEIRVDEKRSIHVTPEKPVDLSRQRDVEKGNGEEVISDGPTDGSRGTGTGLVDRATDMVNKQIFSLDSTLSMVKEPNSNDETKDSNNVGNKSHIISLPRASAETSYRTRFIPNRLSASDSGKERYSDFKGDVHPRVNRNEVYMDKFAKDRLSFRNSRPSFIRGRGRRSGRFGPVHNDWNYDNDFASDNYNGPFGYRGGRHKHTSSIADADLEYSGYRRNTMNDNKFMRHLPEETIDPSYSSPHNMYEFDGQLIREKRNFPATQQKGYPQSQSKSPVRSRARSPGPWSSRRRRSPNGVPEPNPHRSPPVYRMRWMRSPDRASYHEEMVSKRPGSPFIPRHSDDLRDVDSVPERVHARSFNNSNRRSPPAGIFPRNARSGLDTRKTGEVSVEERRKFIERRGPSNSSRPSYTRDGDNFRFHPNDGPRSYRFCPDGDTEFSERSNMREREFNEMSNVREREFVERSNMQEREFNERSNMRERELDGCIKHQQLVASRRIRDIEEQQDGTYRPVRRVWHDEGFNDSSGPKRRRF